MFMEGNFDAYVLWPLKKMVQNWIVDRSTAHDFTVFQIFYIFYVITRIAHYVDLLFFVTKNYLKKH